MPRNQLVQFRRDLGVPGAGLLSEGEPGFSTDLGMLFVGDAAGNPVSVGLINAVDVRMHGAVGDGVTVNNTAFTNAANEAESKGLPLYIPPGDFVLSGAGVPAGWMRSGVVGSGPASIVSVNNTVTGGIGPIGNVRDITFRSNTAVALQLNGGNWYGSTIDTTVITVFLAPQNGKFTNCDFTGVGYTVVVDLTSVPGDTESSILFSNCRFDLPGSVNVPYGLEYRHQGLSTNVANCRCEFSNCSFNFAFATLNALFLVQDLGPYPPSAEYHSFVMSNCVVRAANVQPYLLQLIAGASTRRHRVSMTDVIVEENFPTEAIEPTPADSVIDLILETNMPIGTLPTINAAGHTYLKGSDGIWWNGNQLTP